MLIGDEKIPCVYRASDFFNVDIRVKQVFCFPLLFCLCEEKNFGGSSSKLAPSQTGTNICRRNQLLSSVWTLNSLKWNIAFTEPFSITVTMPQLLIITLDAFDGALLKDKSFTFLLLFLWRNFQQIDSQTETNICQSVSE